MSSKEVKVPNIGDFKEVEVIDVLVNPGDSIKVDQPLLTVESDKASMEIPSSTAGVVKELKVKIGDKVGEGSVIAMVEAAGAAAAAKTPAPAPATAPAPQAPPPQSSPGGGGSKSVEVRVPDIGDFKDVAVI